MYTLYIYVTFIVLKLQYHIQCHIRSRSRPYEQLVLYMSDCDNKAVLTVSTIMTFWVDYGTVRIFSTTSRSTYLTVDGHIFIYLSAFRRDVPVKFDRFDRT